MHIECMHRMKRDAHAVDGLDVVDEVVAGVDEETGRHAVELPAPALPRSHALISDWVTQSSHRLGFDTFKPLDAMKLQLMQSTCRPGFDAFKTV